MQSSENPSQRYNTLSFTLEQKYDNDIIYVAASIPYSYSRLLSLLSNVEKVAKLNSNIYFKKESHISTISSNLVPIITLTWKRDTTKNHKINPKKKIIAIIARQHPCETVSSWVMEGLINSLVYLTNENSVELLKKYIFKIIPMFNVDGVIYGNSRCDISGSDTNRKWTPKPNSFLYPVTHNSKKLFSQLINEGYDIEYFIDLHGHSKKLGTFVYACKTMDEIETRMLSWLMGKVCNKFSWENCIFGLAKTKV
jgi:murein tripeptide amidase MpaA